MPLISVEREKEVRAMLQGGSSNRQISLRTGVSRATIAAIKKTPKLRKRAYKKVHNQESKRIESAKRCLICGAKVRVWPCLFCHPRRGGELASVTNTERKRLAKVFVCSAEIPELFRITYDLLELYKLGLINHPLFKSLAMRANSCFRRILKQKEPIDATKEENHQVKQPNRSV